ncbi:riboflavin biosynthesis protein RibD [Oceaniferula spumae]|uniref:Riboflavin biosynthesis protein RibD n=1 Tax=Oceaniferula spumae TaxID=2979115 RepID=A0AAT9FMU6_9BACT
MNVASDDRQWMQLAISEAQNGIGLTSPNPPVGAVIVKDGKLLGKGWHHRAGEPHAEREALADARANRHDLSGATIYVTLEPCSSHGRTPPCTDGILESGISRVVYGAEDPNPSHRGRAKELLLAAGVEVETGVEKDGCEHLIRAFSKVHQTGLPWVLIKSAISLDGRITRPPGEGQWLTSPESREEVQCMRYESDAIITGGNTLRIDDPALTVRSISLPEKPQPWRMIISRGYRSSLPATAQVFTDAHRDRTLVQEDGDLLAALKQLVSKGCNQVMVEAGGQLLGAFLDAGLVDEVAIFYAAMITGGPDAGFAGLPREVHLKQHQFKQIGNDVLLRALIQQP